MPITTLFWDIGGVLLTNGWEMPSRRAAAKEFGFDWPDYERRHRKALEPLETGQITLDQYLDQTLFWRRRPFSREEIKTYMRAQTKPIKGSIALAAAVADAERYHMFTLNNESKELNVFRIQTFQLHTYFAAFFSSCFIGIRKPNRRIYERAMAITQRKPSECLFIDDRPANLKAARRLGIHIIHFTNASRLQRELHRRRIL